MMRSSPPSAIVPVLARSSQNRRRGRAPRVPGEGLGERRPPREDPHGSLRNGRRQGGAPGRRGAARRGRDLQAAGARGTSIRRCSRLSAVTVPPMSSGELAADREPEPAAAEAARGRLVGLGEGLEDLLDRRGIHADAGIAHRDLEPSRRPASRSASTVRLDARPRPASVNLTALPTRFMHDLPDAQRIAEQLPRMPRRRAQRSARCPWPRPRRRTASAHSSSRLTRSSGSASSSTLPA